MMGLEVNLVIDLFREREREREKERERENMEQENGKVLLKILEDLILEIEK